MRGQLVLVHDNIRYDKFFFETGTCGRFRMFLNKEKQMLYKNSYTTKIRKEMMIEEMFQKYKYIIENAEQLSFMGKHLINGKVVKPNCGDYTTRFIPGYRFDHLYRIKDKELLLKIQKQIHCLTASLREAEKNNCLFGDWGIQNLIYNEKDDIIYNIDTEGFYSYSKRMPTWCNLDLTIKKMNESLYLNPLMHSFTAIIWNKGLLNKDQVLNMLPNVICDYTFSIDKKDLDKTIFDIYSMDQRCNHEVVLPKKIEKLKNSVGNEHLIVQFVIVDPCFNKKNISSTACDIRKNIRSKFGNIIHISDNYEESNYLWSNYSPSFKFDVYIKCENNITTISQNELNGNNVNVISVFKGLIHYTNPMYKIYVYKKKTNNCYFSNNSVPLNNEDKLCFFFYTTSHMVSRFGLVKK